MSTSGPYRSNSLNLVVQQFRRLRDEVQRAMRQGSIAAVWTLQVAIYPFYVVFQTTRLMGRQLRQAAKQAMPRLQAVAQTVQESTQPTQPHLSLTADTPIKNTLRSLPKNLDSISIALPSPSSSSAANHTDDDTDTEAIAPTHPTIPDTFTIRGFASLLSTGNLVLVTEKNQILDRLSSDQQSQLQQIMRRELALYHREIQRLAPVVRSLPPETQRVLPLPEIHQHQWLPVQWIRQFMTWMQLSDVAIAANLFREMQLIATPLPANIHLDAHTERRIQDARQAWFISHLSPLPLDEREHRETQFLPESFTTQKQLPASPTLTVKPLEIPIPSMLTKLINWSKNSQLTHENSASEAEIELKLLDEQSPFSINQWPAPAFFALNWQSPVGEDSLDLQAVSLQVQAGDRQLSNPTSRSTSSTLAATESDDIDLLDWSRESDQLDTKTDANWVDTEAIVVSYIKHPLEQVLEWVDMGMLWLESRLLSFWHWLKQTQDKD